MPSFIATLGASTLIFSFTLFLGKTQTFNPAYPATGRPLDPAQLAFHGVADRSLASVTLAIQRRTEIARALAQDPENSCSKNPTRR